MKDSESTLGLLILTPCLGPFSNFLVYNHNAKTISLWRLRNFVISLGFTAFAVSPPSCTLPSQWVLQPPPLPKPRFPWSLFGKQIPSSLLCSKVASASCGSSNFLFPSSLPFLQLGHYRLVTHLQGHVCWNRCSHTFLWSCQSVFNILTLFT